MLLKIIFLFAIILIQIFSVNGQVATGGQSDRTQQELALLGWTSGVRMAYCQSISVVDLVDPFREAIARMLNRHCRTPIACGLKKSVNFNKFQVVLLDGFPRRENRALNFRFFVVYPHDAIPFDKRSDKPMVPSLILSDMLNSQLSELTHGLGWQVISHEQYPRFDPTTSFFNRFLIPIAVAMGLCMIFLAYWVSLVTSGSSLYANGWLVRGSSGGKNAALRRTMQIIEEQKYRFALYDSQTKGTPLALGSVAVAPNAVVIYKTNARVQEVHAPPKSLATSSSSPKAAEIGRAMPIYPAPGRVSQQQMILKDKKVSKEEQTPRKDGLPHQVSSSEILPSPNLAVPMRRKQINKPIIPIQPTAYDEKEMAEMADYVPEIVVMSHPRDSSMDTIDTTTSTQGRKLSLGQGHRRSSRRFSFGEEFKRRKSFFPGSKERSGNKGNQQERQKRWKASSIALSKFSIVGSRK